MSDDAPKYFRTACLVAALEKVLPAEDLSHQDTVGYKLLMLRSEKEGDGGVRDIVMKEMASLAKQAVSAQKERKQGGGPQKGGSNTAKEKRTLLTQAKKPPKRKDTNAHKKKPGAIKYYCQFTNCHVRGNDLSKFEQVPSFPQGIPTDASDARRATHAKKCRRRRLWLEHCQIDQKHEGRVLICRDHPRYSVKRSAMYQTKDGKLVTLPFTFDNVPMPIGSNSVRFDAEGNSLGLGSDRQKRKTVEKAGDADLEDITGEIEQIEGLSGDAKARVMEAVAPIAKDAASWRMTTQNRSELAESEDVSDINASVRDAAGLGVHVKGASPQKRPPTEIPVEGPRSASSLESNKKPRAARLPPIGSAGGELGTNL